MIFKVTNTTASADLTRHHHRLGKNSLSELRLLAQSDSPMSGTLTSTNKNGDVIFTTVSHTLTLPGHTDLQQGDHLVLMIKEEGNRYFAQVLQRNKASAQHKLELNVAQSYTNPTHASTRGDTIVMQPFPAEVVITNIQQSILRNTFAPLLGMLNKNNIGQQFNAELTPILDAKQELPPQSMMGKIEQIMPHNRVEIVVRHITIETTLPMQLPLNSKVAIKFLEPVIVNKQISPNQNTNVRTQQALPSFLSRLNFHWAELENILQNINPPQLHNLYERMSKLLTPSSHQKDVMSRLRYIASASSDKRAIVTQHHTQNKNAILLHTLAKELKQIIHNNDPASSTIEIQNTLWHHAPFPFFYEGQMYELPVYVRQDSQKQFLRFIIEPDFEHMGRIQIDGIIYFSSATRDIIEGTIKSINLTVRSMEKLAMPIQEAIGEIIETHSHLAGIKSQFEFSVANYFPIDTPK